MKLIFLILILFSFHAFGQQFRCNEANENSFDTELILNEIMWDYQAQALHNKMLKTQMNETKVTLAHRYSIKLYSDYMYKEVNSILREKNSFDHVINYLNALCSALNKLPDYKGEVFRAVRFSTDDIEKYKVGEVYTELGFMSTSSTQEGMQKFIRNSDKEYNVFLYIQSKTGKDISDISKWQDEDEILFRAGTRFKVQKKYKSFWTSRYSIWLEEIVD